jgi:hypothetical protein
MANLFIALIIFGAGFAIGKVMNMDDKVKDDIQHLEVDYSESQLVEKEVVEPRMKVA